MSDDEKGVLTAPIDEAERKSARAKLEAAAAERRKRFRADIAKLVVVGVFRACLAFPWSADLSGIFSKLMS